MEAARQQINQPYRSVPVTAIYERNDASAARIVCNRGGARSSKSHSLAQLLISKLTSEQGKNFLITRKTFPALRTTAYKLIVDLLKEYDYYRFCRHNKSEHVLQYPARQNYMLFSSIDDPEKIKSTEWNYIWMEEATDFTYEDFMTLKLRLSAPSSDGQRNQLFMSFNPIDAFHWIKTELMDKHASMAAQPQEVEEIVSTYLDNPFLAQDYINVLLELKAADPNYWRIYGKAEWGVLENLIYSNWEIIPRESWPGHSDTLFYGLDFGFNNPSALIEISYMDGQIFAKELLYETGLTNNQLIERLGELIPNKTDYIFADDAEPARIAEIAGAGFNVHPADKSVKDGIDFVKRHKILVHPGSTNLIKELRAYKYKEDRDGRVLDEPVKFNDHLMDAKRYGMYTFHLMFGAGSADFDTFLVAKSIAAEGP